MELTEKLTAWTWIKNYVVSKLLWLKPELKAKQLHKLILEKQTKLSGNFFHIDSHFTL